METTFGLTLKELGLSVSEASKKVGVRPQTIYRHISGERSVSPSMAVRYEKALGIPRETLRPDLWQDKKEEVESV